MHHRDITIAIIFLHNKKLLPGSILTQNALYFVSAQFSDLKLNLHA